VFGRQASNFGRKYFMSFHNRDMSLEDGGRKIFRNVGIYLSNYKVAIPENKSSKIITSFLK